MACDISRVTRPLPSRNGCIRKAVQEARHGTGADGDVTANSNVPLAQFARHDPLAFPGLRIFYPKKVVRKQRAEPPVSFTDSLGAEGADSLEAAFVNPFLDRDMGFRFELKVPFPSLLAVIVSERSLDIDRVRVVSLDEVRVVAVHRSNQSGKRGK
jgi:hypothetical protein